MCTCLYLFLCACILCIYIYIHVYSVWIYAINIKVPYKTQSSAALLGRHTGGLWHAIASFKMQIRPCGVNHSGPNYSNYPPPIPPVHPFCSLLLRRALESSPGLLVCSPLRYIRAGEKKKKKKKVKIPLNPWLRWPALPISDKLMLFAFQVNLEWHSLEKVFVTIVEALFYLFRKQFTNTNIFDEYYKNWKILIYERFNSV